MFAHRSVATVHGVLLAAVFALPLVALADPQAPADPDRLRMVRLAARGVLTAKRSYQADPVIGQVLVKLQPVSVEIHSARGKAERWEALEEGTDQGRQELDASRSRIAEARTLIEAALAHRLSDLDRGTLVSSLQRLQGLEGNLASEIQGDPHGRSHRLADLEDRLAAMTATPRSRPDQPTVSFGAELPRGAPTPWKPSPLDCQLLFPPGDEACRP